MNFWKSYLQQLDFIYVKKYNLHTTIDELPIWNFYKIQETSDLRYLYDVDDITKIKRLDAQKVVDVWKGILDEYFEQLDVTDEMHSLLLKKKEVAVLRSKYQREKKNIYKSLLAKAEKELREMMTVKDGGGGLDDQVFAVEKFMGFQINPKEVSTRKFFTYIRNINKAVIEQLKAQKNG